jgi:hypothetical protein
MLLFHSHKGGFHMTNRFVGALRAGLVVALLVASSPRASTLMTNYSDLWWKPAESGWGVTITQQADLMYATFYVYGPGGQPTWYAALLLHQGTAPDGTATFAGDLRQFNGSWFGATYNPAALASRSVGTASFVADSGTTATLTYTVDGVVVAKRIERYLLRSDNIAGSYLGGSSDITYDCLVPTNNGFRTEESGAFNVTHVGSVVTIRSPNCTYTGTYHQDGQVSRVDGSYTCSAGAAAGTITFFDVRTELGGLSGRYVGRGSNCSFDGSIGLARRK